MWAVSKPLWEEREATCETPWLHLGLGIITYCRTGPYVRCPERDRLLHGGIITGGSLTTPCRGPVTSSCWRARSWGCLWEDFGFGSRWASLSVLPRDGREAESLCGDIQKPPGCGLGQMALGVPTWAGGLTRSPPEVPSNLSHAVIPESAWHWALVCRQIYENI